MKAYKNRRYGLVSLLTVCMLFFAGCSDSPGYDADKDNGNGSSSSSAGGGGTGGGGTNVIPTITIQNNTGYSISGIYIKPSTSTDWGSDVLSYYSLSDGTSTTLTLSQPLSTQSVYDIRLSRSGSNFIKYNVTVSEGMVVTFTASDLE